jgi:NAD+ diphosphatase
MKILKLPLARSAVDRAGHLRSDDQALANAWANARIIHFNGEAFLLEGGALRYLSAGQIPEHGERIYLGEHEGQNYFLWCATLELAPGAEASDYQTLRAVGHQLSDIENGLAVHAQAVAHWHHATPFCTTCGGALAPAQAGSTRVCIDNGHEHFPRTDPAIIVLTKDKDDRILLGRQKVWPEHRFSTFAGFVEAGESFEQCVAREVAEEAGVQVAEVNYLGSQPWPFPRSLMIAFEAIIVDPSTARPDGEEIEEIRWFDRDSIYVAVREGTLLLPPAMSVARAMIDAWYGSDRPQLSTPESWRN